MAALALQGHPSLGPECQALGCDVLMRVGVRLRGLGAPKGSEGWRVGQRLIAEQQWCP